MINKNKAVLVLPPTIKNISKLQTQFHKSWDTVQIVNKNRMQ